MYMSVIIVYADDRAAGSSHGDDPLWRGDAAHLFRLSTLFASCEWMLATKSPAENDLP